jgi:hypothetical protein
LLRCFDTHRPCCYFNFLTFGVFVMRFHLATILFSLVLVSCGTPQDKQLIAEKKAIDSRMEMQFKDQPDWFLNPPISEDAIYGVGTSSLSNLGAALQQAKLGAMVEITQQISSVVDSMASSTFTGQETNLGSVEQGVFQNAAKAIASAPLRGAVVSNRKTVRGETGLQTYVLVKILKADAARSAVEQVKKLDKEVMENNANMLNDLDEAVRKRL